MNGLRGCLLEQVLTEWTTYFEIYINISSMIIRNKYNIQFHNLIYHILFLM